MYGKLFTQMYDGTLGTKGPWQALVTFQQMVILADEQGVVDMTPEAVARRTTIPIEIIREGIAALEQPDPHSRTPDLEGRRIVRLSDEREWGWRVVNYLHYRAIRTADDRREYMRNYQRERRARVKASTAGKQSQPIAEVEVDVKRKDTVGLKPDIKALRKAAIEILTFLNEKTGRSYQPVPANIDMIVARLKEGASVDDCRAVVEKKCLAWSKDDKMAPYLRPATLFNRTKFAQYRGEIGVKGAGAVNAPPCGNCGKPLTNGWTQSPKGRVCPRCHDGYMGSGWPAPALELRP